jgi:hypothetical protein
MKWLILVLIVLVSSCNTKKTTKIQPVDYTSPMHSWVANARSGSGLGIQLHVHNIQPHNLPWVQHLGADLYRQDFFPEVNYDNFIEATSNSLVLLTVKGPWEGGSHHLDNLQSISKYIHLSNVAWELGNEPNDHVAPVEYSDWATSLSVGIKTLNPQACVVGPATKTLSDRNMQWFTELVQHGILNVLDAVTVHYYWEDHDRGIEFIVRAQKLIRDHSPSTRSIPLFIGEGGADKPVRGDQWKKVMSAYQMAKTANALPFVWYAVDGESPVQVNSQNPTSQQFIEYWAGNN